MFLYSAKQLLNLFCCAVEAIQMARKKTTWLTFDNMVTWKVEVRNLMTPVRVGRSYLKSVLRIQIKTIEPEPTGSKILWTLIQILPGHKNQIFYFVFFSETLKTFHEKKLAF